MILSLLSVLLLLVQSSSVDILEETAAGPTCAAISKSTIQLLLNFSAQDCSTTITGTYTTGGSTDEFPTGATLSEGGGAECVDIRTSTMTTSAGCMLHAACTGTNQDYFIVPEGGAGEPAWDDEEGSLAIFTRHVTTGAGFTGFIQVGQGLSHAWRMQYDEAASVDGNVQAITYGSTSGDNKESTTQNSVATGCDGDCDDDWTSSAWATGVELTITLSYSTSGDYHRFYIDDDLVDSTDFTFSSAPVLGSTDEMRIGVAGNNDTSVYDIAAIGYSTDPTFPWSAAFAAGCFSLSDFGD